MRDVQAKLSQVVMNDVANKPILPLNVDEVVRVTSKCTVPPFGHKAIHGKVNLILHGYKMNVMTHGLEKQSPSLPLGIDVQTVYATLANGSNRVTVVLRNNTWVWLEIKKGMPITRMVATNEVPKVTNLLSAEETKEQPTLTEAERQDKNKIPYPGVKAVLDNAITPIEECAEQGVRPTPDCQGDCQEETVEARPTRLATTNVTDWKQEQKEDAVLYQVAKHLRAPCETFKAALHKVLDKKATAAYVKVKEQLVIKNGILYHKTRQGQADEIVFQFVVPQRHRGAALDGCH